MSTQFCYQLADRDTLEAYRLAAYSQKIIFVEVTPFDDYRSMIR